MYVHIRTEIVIVMNLILLPLMIVADDDKCSCDVSDMEICSDGYLENEGLFNR